MKAGWQLRPLAEIADCCLGKMLDKQKNRGVSQRYLRNINVRWFDFDLTDLLKMPFEAAERERYSVRRGDLVICEGGYPGRCAIWEEDEEIFFQKALHRVRMHEPERARWVQYFLWMSDADGSLRHHFTGSGIQHFTGQALAKLQIPLPPLEEQRRIVAVLDEAFAAIATATANAEKNLANAREFYERILHDVFIEKGCDWIEEPLNTNVRFIDYRGKTPPKRESGVRLITAKNVKMGHIQRAPEEFIDAAAYDGWMTRGFPSKGDVLFTTEAPLGNVAQLDTDEKVVIGQRLITLQPKTGSVDRTFLKYMLCSAPLQDLILRQATGATVSGIKASLLKLIPISYPPQIEGQHEIVKRLDAAYALSNSLTGHYRARIEELSALKKSLLRSAFSGDLSLPITKSLAA